LEQARKILLTARSFLEINVQSGGITGVRMRRTSATVGGTAPSAYLRRLFRQVLRSGGTEFHGIGDHV